MATGLQQIQLPPWVATGLQQLQLPQWMATGLQQLQLPQWVATYLQQLQLPPWVATGLPAAPATPSGWQQTCSKQLQPLLSQRRLCHHPRHLRWKGATKDAQEVCVDTEIMKYLNTKNTQEDAEDDEDTKFFRSLAKSCQKLSPRTRSILKMKMYSLMHEAELQELSFQPRSSTSQDGQ